MRKKINKIVTQLFIRGRKSKLSLVFILQSYQEIPEDIRLGTAHFFFEKIPSRPKLQQIAFNHCSCIFGR